MVRQTAVTDFHRSTAAGDGTIDMPLQVQFQFGEEAHVDQNQTPAPDKPRTLQAGFPLLKLPGRANSAIPINSVLLGITRWLLGRAAPKRLNQGTELADQIGRATSSTLLRGQPIDASCRKPGSAGLRMAEIELCVVDGTTCVALLLGWGSGIEAQRPTSVGVCRVGVRRMLPAGVV